MSTPEKKIEMDPAMQDFFGTTDPQEYQELMVQFQRNFITTTRKLSQTSDGRKRLSKAGLSVLSATQAQQMLAALGQ